MPRVLTIGRTTVAADQREAFVARTRRRAQHYRGADIRYWVFEEASLPGSFVEFCEAGDVEALARAHGATTDPAPGSERVYVERGEA